MALDNEWSLYEAAILLDAYLGVRAGSIERSSAVKNISCALRKMAKNCGQTIDAKYRNESGIHFQLLGMESAFVGRTVVKPASALFSKIVDLYRNSFEEYEAILSEARAMVDKPRSNIELFQDWLASNAPTLSCSAVLSDLAVAESYCMKKLLLKAPILDTTDVGVIRRILAAVESDKIFRVTYKNRKNSIHKATALYYKYIKYLNTQHDDNSGAVLEHSSETEANSSVVLPSNVKNSDPVLAYLEANNVEYIDQRGPVGCLWVIDNASNTDTLLNPLRAAGMIWVYTRDGGEVTNHRPAYWTKDSCPEFRTEQSADSIVSNEPHDRPIGLPASASLKTDDQSTNGGSTNEIDSDPVLAYLEANNIEYIDLRGRQGCLWVTSTDPNVEALLEPLRAAGMNWSYARTIGKSTDSRSALWTKDSSEGIFLESKQEPCATLDASIESSVKDRRLRLKYPKEYTLIRKKLFEIAPEEGEGVTLSALQDALNLQVAYFVSSDILSNAPWAERCGNNRYGMALFRYVGRFSEEEEDTASDSERTDSIKESLCQTLEYLKSRYSVRLAYDHFETPTKYSNDMLYKAKNACKDVMWIYYIHSRTSHYVSVETEPEYLENTGHDFSGFKSIIKRQSHPRLKMIFEDYEAIRASLVAICDAIDSYFTNAQDGKTTGYGTNDEIAGDNPSYTTIPVPLPRTENVPVKKAEPMVMAADLDGITVESLAVQLGIPVSTAKKIVQESASIVAVCDRLIHKDAFMDWDDGADKLEAVLEKLMIRNNGYVSDVQLYDYARIEMPMFLNDNDIDDKRKLFDIAEHLFGKERHHGKQYTFWMKTHISAVQNEITSKLDVMRKFARDEGGLFKEEDLENYLKSLGIKTANLRQQMRVYSEPIFLFYATGVFITTESMGVNEAWLSKTAKALSQLFADVGDHIILRDIQPWWYNLLPELPENRPWTPLLLQSVLMHYSKMVGARTIVALTGQNSDTLNAMLVSLNSEIQTFADAVIAVLVENQIEKRRFEAEELRRILLNHGLISGNELIWNMPKALPNDGRFVWDADGLNVTINI